MKKLHYIKGFTLVELVVVIAIFGVLFTVVSSTFINSLRAAMKAQATQEVRQNGEAAISRMVHELKGAERIDSCPCQTTSCAPGNERIRFVDPDTNEIIRFAQAGGSMIRTVVSPSVGLNDRLTDQASVRVVPGTVFFNCVDLGRPGERVEISFELEYVPFGGTGGTSSDGVRIPFRTTVVNRNVN